MLDALRHEDDPGLPPPDWLERPIRGARRYDAAMLLGAAVGWACIVVAVICALMVT